MTEPNVQVEIDRLRARVRGRTGRLTRVMLRFQGGPMLIGGLDPARRKQALRDVRRRTPSSNPVLLAVEHDLARRQLASLRFSRWLFTVLLVLNVFNAVPQWCEGAVAIATINTVGAIVFAVYSVYCFIAVPRLRAFERTG